MEKVKWATCALIFGKRENAGKILAVSRKDNHEDFGLPGGKLDDDETLEQCVIREVKEETGLDVINTMFFFGNLSDNQGYYVATYICQVSGDLHTPEKVEELGEGIIRWVDWSEIETGFNGSYNRHLRYFFEKFLEDEGFTSEEFYKSLAEPLNWE